MMAYLKEMKVVILKVAEKFVMYTIQAIWWYNVIIGLFDFFGKENNRQTNWRQSQTMMECIWVYIMSCLWCIWVYEYIKAGWRDLLSLKQAAYIFTYNLEMDDGNTEETFYTSWNSNLRL